MGGDFIDFKTFLQQEGIQFRFSCLYTHHQNGTVKRKHRHIVETGLTLLAQSHLPISFLWEAFHTGSYLINRMPTQVLGNFSHFHKLHNQLPGCMFLKVFGYSCFPLLRPYNQHKLDFHTKKCVFIGYSPLYKGYKCLDRSGRVFVARHVTFNETEFPYSELFSKHASSTLDESNSIPPSPVQIYFFQNSTSSDSSNGGSPTAIFAPTMSHVSTPSSAQQSSLNSSPNHSYIPPSSIESPQPVQSLQPLQPIHPMITRAKAVIFKPKTYIIVTQNLEPTNFKAALQDSKWYLAMKEEFEALQKNNTWTLVPPHAAAKIVRNKWLYRVKYNPDGSIAKYKARLVAKGFHQTHGINFFETYSLVVKSCTVRIVLSLVVMHHWSIRQ